MYQVKVFTRNHQGISFGGQPGPRFVVTRVATTTDIKEADGGALIIFGAAHTIDIPGKGSRDPWIKEVPAITSVFAAGEWLRIDITEVASS